MTNAENKTLDTLQKENHLLKTELAAERFILEQLNRLNASEIISEGIQEMLEALGNYVYADRSYIFENTDASVFTYTYEWCQPGIPSQIQELKYLFTTQIPNWMEEFSKGNAVHMDSTRTLFAPDAPEYELLERLQIHTLVVFPLILHNRLTGFIGLDNPDLSRSQPIQHILKLLGQNVALAIENDKNEQNRLKQAADDTRLQYQRDMERILSGAQIGIWSIEQHEGQAPLMTGDQTMYHLLGVQPDISPEACYDFWFQNIEPTTMPQVMTAIERVLNDGYAEVTYPWHHPTRGLLWIRCGGVLFERYPDGGFCLRGYHQDVTLTSKKDRKYKNLLNATTQIYHAIYMIDLANDTMEQISVSDDLYHLDEDHPTASKKMKQICQFFVREDYQPQMLEFFDLSTLTARLAHKPYTSREYPNPQGIWRRASFIIPDSEKSSDHPKVLYVTQIIDEYKQKELSWQLKMVEAADEAQKANAAKSDFLSRMSHDIRTPINGIMGLLDMEELDPTDLTRRQECHEKIRLCTSHLLALINDVLDMNKLESGELILDPTLFDIRELLENCWTFLEAQAAKMDLTLHRIAPGSLPYPHVVGSTLHIRQIFTNLLSNSIKYNKPHGSITIEASMLSHTKDTVVYQFIITDTGIGMTEEFLEHIFEPFTQENQGARTSYQGTGLGMSIVHRLVEALNGSIQVESAKNVGSRFILTIPFGLPVDDLTLEKDDADDLVDVSGMHVLIVEDNDLNREIAQCLLEDAGIHVSTVCNGLEAFRAFEHSLPGYYDLILMDIMMPVMDGLEATRQIRSCIHPDAKRIPIIAMSANAFSDDVRASKAAGMNEHLAKPLETAKLLKVLKHFMIHRDKRFCREKGNL